MLWNVRHVRNGARTSWVNRIWFPYCSCSSHPLTSGTCPPWSHLQIRGPFFTPPCPLSPLSLLCRLFTLWGPREIKEACLWPLPAWDVAFGARTSRRPHSALLASSSLFCPGLTSPLQPKGQSPFFCLFSPVLFPDPVLLSFHPSTCCERHVM